MATITTSKTTTTSKPTSSPSTSTQPKPERNPIIERALRQSGSGSAGSYSVDSGGTKVVQLGGGGKTVIESSGIKTYISPTGENVKGVVTSGNVPVIQTSTTGQQYFLTQEQLKQEQIKNQQIGTLKENLRLSQNYPTRSYDTSYGSTIIEYTRDNKKGFIEVQPTVRSSQIQFQDRTGISMDTVGLKTLSYGYVKGEERQGRKPIINPTMFPKLKEEGIIKTETKQTTAEINKEVFNKSYLTSYMTKQEPKKESALTAFGLGATKFFVSPFKFAYVENWNKENKLQQKTFADVIGLKYDFSKQFKYLFKEEYKGEMFVNYGSLALFSGLPTRIQFGTSLGLTGYTGYQTIKNPTAENFGQLAASSLVSLSLIKPTFQKGRFELTIQSELKPYKISQYYEVKPTGRTNIKESILEYPRQQYLQKTSGFNKIKEFELMGKAKYEGKEFSITGIKKGRESFLFLKGNKEDIIYYKPKSSRVIKTTLLQKNIFGKYKTETSFFIKPQKETLKLFTSTTKGKISFSVSESEKLINLKDLSIAKAEALQTKTISGSLKDFIKGRDISKTFISTSSSKLTQFDKSTYGALLISQRGKKTLSLVKGEIQYIKSIPEYQPTTKQIFKENIEGLEFKYFKQPELQTIKENILTSSTLYKYSQSRSKPLKNLLNMEIFKSKSGSLLLGQKVKIQSQLKPQTVISQKQPVFTGSEILSGLSKLNKPRLIGLPSISKSIVSQNIFNLPSSRQQNKVILRNNIIPKTSNIIKPLLKTTPILKVSPKISTTSSLRNETLPSLRIVPGTIITYPSYPKSNIPILKLEPILQKFPFNYEKVIYQTKKKKPKKLNRSKRKFGYTASVQAVEFNIFGKQPKRLSGVELRPLLKKFKPVRF